MGKLVTADEDGFDAMSVYSELVIEPRGGIEIKSKGIGEAGGPARGPSGASWMAGSYESNGSIAGARPGVGTRNPRWTSASALPRQP